MDIDPAEFYDRIVRVSGERSKAEKRIVQLLAGIFDEYDNIHQVLDDFAYAVLDEVVSMQKKED